MKLPVIIQGGMGVAISNWTLAKAVSRWGQLGVISGTGINRVLASRLADGDIGGHMRRALESLPLPEVVQNILERYYIPGGKAPADPYKTPPAYTVAPPIFLDQLTALANYVEVFLAKENHSGPVGINLLEKVQLPNLASLYGAMLAGVDYVLMGAGIPTQVAAILDKLAHHEPVSYRLDVHGAGPDDDVRIHFDPERIFPGIARLAGQLKRPKFLPIISSVTLAQALLKRSEGKIDGFVVEGPTAGGHNAPPRGALKLSDTGEPIYGDKDVVDPQKMKPFGLPFWFGGGYGNPQQVKNILAAGATGVQVGTAFALCGESGMEASLKQSVLRQVLDEAVQVFTSPNASPTGFPFKVAQVAGTMSDTQLYAARNRICDLGFLRVIFRKEDGSLNYRCAAEPVDDYLRKGGELEDTEGRACLCNNLMATAGYGQRRKDGTVERPLVTSGDDLMMMSQFVPAGATGYSAEAVLRYLLGSLGQMPAAQGA